MVDMTHVQVLHHQRLPAERGRSRRLECAIPLEIPGETQREPKGGWGPHAERFRPAGASGALSATCFNSFSQASSLNGVSRATRCKSATNSAADSYGRSAATVSAIGG